MDNQPVFPVGIHSGLIKREYYAAAALTGLLVGHKSIYEIDDNLLLKYPNAFASFAFKIADAMILESAKETNGENSI